MNARNVGWVVGLVSLGLVTACGGSSSNDSSRTGNELGAGSAGQSQVDHPTLSDGGATNDHTEACTAAPSCQSSCTSRPGACLGKPDGSAPTAGGLGMSTELNFVAKVTAIARDVWAPPRAGDLGCLGSPASDRIHVSVADDAGLTWELSLSPSQVDEHHFAVGDELSIQYYFSELALFTRDQRLVIRKAGDIDLFFVYGSNSFQGSGKPFDDSALALSMASVACDGTSPSGAACSTQRTTVAVSDGATSFNEPCARNIGPFQVSADFTAAACGGTAAGSCDATSTLYLAGVRR